MSKPPVIATLVACLVGSTLVACKQDSAPGSQTAFSLMPQQGAEAVKATFARLRESRDVDICVGHVGYSHDSAKARYRTDWARRAVVAWVSVVQQSPDWQDKSQRNFRVTPVSGPCPNNFRQDSTDFKFNYFASIHDQVALMCGAGSPVRDSLQGEGLCSTSRNYAITWTDSRTILMGTMIGSGVRPESFMEQTALHEFGHVLGLGDTYKALGVNYEGVNAPSIMNYDSGGAILSSDDKLGAWTVERATRTGQWGCNGVHEARNLNPANGRIYCQPPAGALRGIVQAHQKLGAQAAMRELVGKRIRVRVTQATTIKKQPVQSNTLGEAEKCTLPQGAEVVGVLVSRVANGVGDHAQIAYEAVPGACAGRDGVASRAWFYSPHVTVEPVSESATNDPYVPTETGNAFPSAGETAPMKVQ